MTFTSIAPSMQQIARVALVVTVGIVTIVSAKAQEYSTQQRMACMPDAFRFCSDEIPDAGRVRACMIANKANLSAGCRAMFRS